MLNLRTALYQVHWAIHWQLNEKHLDWTCPTSNTARCDRMLWSAVLYIPLLIKKLSFADLHPKPASTQVGNPSPSGYAILQCYSVTAHLIFFPESFSCMSPQLARSLIFFCNPVPISLYLWDKLWCCCDQQTWSWSALWDLLVCRILHIGMGYYPREAKYKTAAVSSSSLALQQRRKS